MASSGSISGSSITDRSKCVILEFPEGTALGVYVGKFFEYVAQKKEGSHEGISIQSFRDLEGNRAVVQFQTAAG